MQVNLHRILLLIIHESKLRPLNGENACILLDAACSTGTYADQFTQNIAIHHS